jgi:hypothetical protein
MSHWFHLPLSRPADSYSSPESRNNRLRLEALEDRVVPSGLDLTGVGSQGTFGSGVIFQQGSVQPAGSGVIDAFVRIHGLGGAGTEQGYNTDARPLQFDENQSPTFTRSLPLSQVPLLNISGTNYRIFLLDINQKASQPLVSLDQLQILVSASGNLTGYGSRQLPGATLLYDMNPDGSGTNWVQLDGRLNQGLGKSDMALLVPDALFVSVNAGLGAVDPDVYVFSRFGDHFATNGGFEQWAVQGTTPTGSLSGFVYNDANKDGVFDTGDSGIGGVMMTLTGYDLNGNAVTLNAVTNGNGFYFFDGLMAGTYTIIKNINSTALAGFKDGAENLGSLGGILGTDLMRAISLGAGQNGVNYNFGEILSAS